MKCPQCQQENPTQAKFCLDCAAPIDGATPAPSSFAEMKAEIESLRRSLTEALEQQTATSEILGIISRSRTDVQPVFDTIVRSAEKLCGGLFGALVRFDVELVHFVAHHNFSAAALDEVRRTWPTRPSRTSGSGRAILDRAVVQIPDIELDPEYGLKRLSRAVGHRSSIYVPMLRDGLPIGVIVVARAEAGRFADDEVALLQTFADQAVIAIENVRLFTELEARNVELAESLNQQSATAEILGVISSSPTDIRPVLETIVENAGRVCEAFDAIVYLVEGRELVRVAHRGPVPVRLEGDRIPVDRRFMSGHVVLEGRTIQTDLLDSDDYPGGRALAERDNFRSAVSTPLMKDGIAIGTLVIRRTEARPFTAKQVALLETFARQAVIAIENVRLFTELQEKNRALTEAHAQVTETLEQQTATADILKVIAGSPTDLQPIFDVIVESACRLCDAVFVNAIRFDGELMHNMAQHGFSPEAYDAILRHSPMRPTRESMFGRAILNRAVVQCEDVSTDVEAAVTRQLSGLLGFRALVAVPMLRDGIPVGAILVGRRAPGFFPDRQVDLLRAFADQAVIALENVRLFKELQEINRALTQAHGQVTEALEQQTATSEILRTIAQAQTDVQPVFDTIVRSAARLCHAANAAVFLTDGSMLYHPANYGSAPEVLAAVRAQYPRPVDRDTTPGLAIVTRSVVHVPDIEEPATLPHVREIGRLLGFRSVVAVPMLREGKAVGVVNVARRGSGGFSDGEVELLKTFADQAVIAIENVRLFRELEARTAALTRSVDQLTALGEVGRAVSSTLDLETVLTTIVAHAVQLSGLDGGVVFEYDESAEEFVQRVATETGGALAEARRTTRIRKGEGALGRTAITLEPVQVPDITAPGAYAGRLRENLIESGIRAILAVPMAREGRLIGCLGVMRNRPGEFPAETIDLLRTFATQSALAIQNAKLFREIEDKSRQLEVASQHKSEFLANMSHELRTPLNAVIGFSEVLVDRMFGALNEKQEEYLKDIHASGQHLLSLINDILDLSKIEAGRMDLEPTEFDLPVTLENALTLVHERAGRHGITLHMSADERVRQVRADERKIRQVVLNLLSNAIKFTPAGGRIEVRAVPSQGGVEVSVSDTGVGIASEDQEAIFEEFRQVGTAAKKVEGTGLGLALSRKFIELHGGRIWVQSQVGAGSTFTFTLPARRGE